MRSRPDLKVYLSPGVIEPGAHLHVEAELVSRSRTPIDGVEFHLVGTERRRLGTSVAGQSPLPIYQQVQHVERLASTRPMMLEKGSHRVTADFELPLICPPAYRSALTVISYDLAVRVAIPWWPDRSERYLVSVVATPSRVEGEPMTFCSDGAGPQGKALYLEASLESAVIDHGGVVRGAVSVANIEHHRIRRIDLMLVVDERPNDRSSAPHEVQRYLVKVHEGAPVAGEAIPFSVRLSEAAPPSFRGSLIEVRWHLEICAVVALGNDVSLRIPIQVLRRAAGTPSEVVSPDRVPPIGRRRRALVWAESARRHGLANDAEAERMTLELDAGASLSIALEPRKDAALVYTATVVWPHLGIDLAVTERRWVDGWSKARVHLDVPGFSERFTVRGREPAQVLAFLDDEGARALLAFDESALGDDGATLVRAGTAQSVDDLDAFVARAIAAARTLAQAGVRIPPPAAMAAFVPAWRALASALGGRLSLGEMEIRDAIFDQAPVKITTAWTDEGQARATLLCFPIAARDGVATSEAELDPAARALLASLQTQTQALRIEPAAITAEVAAPLVDPASIEPTLIGLARLARLLGGGAARGPYR